MFDLTWKEKFLKAKEAYMKRDFATIIKYAAEAETSLKKDDFVSAEPLFKWIEREWLEKGLARGVIVVKDGLYYPVVREIEAEEVTGHRGRTPIVEKKRRIDASGFLLFLFEYERYKKTKSKM